MASLPSGLPEHVADDEDLARFVVQSNQVNTMGVKPAAYLPNPHTHDTSVFRFGADSIEAIRTVGKQAMADRRVHGVAICKAADVRSAQLDVLASEPPPRHANIVKWPFLNGDPSVDKAACKERAMTIASRATFHEL